MLGRNVGCRRDSSRFQNESSPHFRPTTSAPPKNFSVSFKIMFVEQKCILHGDDAPETNNDRYGVAFSIPLTKTRARICAPQAIYSVSPALSAHPPNGRESGGHKSGKSRLSRTGEQCGARPTGIHPASIIS